MAELAAIPFIFLTGKAGPVVLVTDEDVVVHNHTFLQKDRAFPCDRNG